jgi:HEAT repeat protein
MTLTHPLAATVAAFLLGTLGMLGMASASAEPMPSEPELLAVLRSDTAEAGKAIACKQLAIKGSKAAVDDLAKLLTNERLASWARIALEAIPGPEADAALRSAAGTLSGRLAVGAINSLGVRRDAAATALLAGKLADPNAEVVAAAAAALGKIGTADSAAALTKALVAGGPQLDTLAEAAVVGAERLVASGKVADAAKLFEAVRVAKVSEQRVAEATRGLILARGKEGIPLLVETLRSPSKRLANIGLFTARELLDGPQAGDVDMALAAEVTRQAGTAGGERAALLIKVLADRNADGGAGSGLQAIVMRWAKEGPQAVRLAAL